MANNAKIIIVSGGSKGLGKGIVETLLKNGDIVATFSRMKSPFIEELESGKFADRFYWEAVDGTAYDKVSSFAKKIFSKYGKIDALINNAGVAVDAVLTLMQARDISRLLALNLEGSIRLTQACVKYMLQTKDGVIINISSIIGQRGYSGLSVYSATKGGLDAFTRALSRELGPRGIRVNSIAPGYLDTDMSNTLEDRQRQQIIRRTPLGRLGKVDDVVGTIKFLLSPDARFITGQTIVIDGGITC